MKKLSLENAVIAAEMTEMLREIEELADRYDTRSASSGIFFAAVKYTAENSPLTAEQVGEEFGKMVQELRDSDQ